MFKSFIKFISKKLFFNINLLFCYYLLFLEFLSEKYKKIVIEAEINYI